MDAEQRPERAARRPRPPPPWRRSSRGRRAPRQSRRGEHAGATGLGVAHVGGALVVGDRPACSARCRRRGGCGRGGARRRHVGGGQRDDGGAGGGVAQRGEDRDRGRRRELRVGRRARCSAISSSSARGGAVLAEEVAERGVVGQGFGARVVSSWREQPRRRRRRLPGWPAAPAPGGRPEPQCSDSALAGWPQAARRPAILWWMALVPRRRRLIRRTRNAAVSSEAHVTLRDRDIADLADASGAESKTRRSLRVRRRLRGGCATPLPMLYLTRPLPRAAFACRARATREMYAARCAGAAVACTSGRRRRRLGGGGGGGGVPLPPPATAFAAPCRASSSARARRRRRRSTTAAPPPPPPRRGAARAHDVSPPPPSPPPSAAALTDAIRAAPTRRRRVAARQHGEERLRDRLPHACARRRWCAEREEAPSSSAGRGARRPTGGCARRRGRRPDRASPPPRPPSDLPVRECSAVSSNQRIATRASPAAFGLFFLRKPSSAPRPGASGGGHAELQLLARPAVGRHRHHHAVAVRRSATSSGWAPRPKAAIERYLRRGVRHAALVDVAHVEPRVRLRRLLDSFAACTCDGSATAPCRPPARPPGWYLHRPRRRFRADDVALRPLVTRKRTFGGHREREIKAEA